MPRLAIVLAVMSYTLAVVNLGVLLYLARHRLPGKPIRFGTMRWIGESFDRAGYTKPGQRLMPLYTSLNTASVVLILAAMFVLLSSAR